MPHPLLKLFQRPDNPPRIQLQARDERIVELVWRYRFLTLDLLKLHLHHRATDTALRQRLRALFVHGFLDRPQAQLVSRINGDERTTVYALGLQGAKLLARVLGIPIEKSRWTQKNNEAKIIYLDHTLACARFRTLLSVALRDHARARLFHWAEKNPALHATLTHPPRLFGEQSERLKLIPDGFFGVHFPREPEGANKSYFFLEMDRATEPLSRFVRAKGRGYREYRKSGDYQRLGIKGFRVLIVAPNQSRLQSLRQSIAAWLKDETDHPLEKIQMWLFASEERYSLTNPMSILAPIWQTVGDERFVSLLD